MNLFKKKEEGTEDSRPSAGSKAVEFVGKGISRLMPRGGIRHPDLLVRNRELYAGNGKMPSVLPGVHPRPDKTLLTGYPTKLTTSTVKKVPLYPGQSTGTTKTKRVRRIRVRR